MPSHPAMRSSKSPHALDAGCTVRLRPTSPERFARPCRKSIIGVPMEPPASTTVFASTRMRPLRPPLARATTPTARPPARSTSSTLAWWASIAPALSAAGTYVTFVDRFASVGQPKTHCP